MKKFHNELNEIELYAYDLRNILWEGKVIIMSVKLEIIYIYILIIKNCFSLSVTENKEENF